jgi:YfiH family protein
MPFYDAAGLRYFSFKSLEEHSITQAIFTRRGGSSPAPWASLNVGGTVGDQAGRVAENRQRVFEAFSRPIDSAFEVWQVHGTNVVIAGSPRTSYADLLNADAVLTDNPQVTLFMRFADCVPILLSDRMRGVVGLVHAGWQGTVQKTALAAIEAMQDVFGSQPAEISAGIGPSIGPDHYEVGGDVVAQVHLAFGNKAIGLLPQVNGKTYFDLWEANRLLLASTGITRIEIAGLCTGCQLTDWYSHRLEKGQTGRFAALIALQA